MLRWAVMGTGMIAGKVLPAIAAAPGGTVSCVASRSIDRARSFAFEHGLPPAAACDYESLPSRSDVDAVYVTLPNSLHTPWCVRLLEAGKHVICEKPLTPRAADARLIATTARRAQRLFSEGLMYLHHPQTDLLIAAGRHRNNASSENLIGPLQLIVASFCIDLRPRPNAWTRFSRNLEGGAMMDLGCYPLSLARAITGEEPSELAAISRPAEVPSGETLPVDACTSFVARFPSGVLLHALGAIDSNAGVFAELVGQWGTLRTETPFRADPVRAEVRLTRFELHPRGPGTESIVIENGGDRFVNQFARFNRAAAGDGQMFPTPDWSVGQADAIERILKMVSAGS